MLSHVRIAKTRRRPAHPAGTGVPRPGKAGGGGVLSGLLRAGGAAFIFAGAGRRLVHRPRSGPAAAGHRRPRRPGPHL